MTKIDDSLAKISTQEAASQEQAKAREVADQQIANLPAPAKIQRKNKEDLGHQPTLRDQGPSR